MLATLAAPLLLASMALAHIQINYPLGQRDFEEETQETGAFCGGGSYTNASAWGVQDAFISLSGDAGQQITVLWATGSSSDPASTSRTSDFATTLLANATFPTSGNFCFNVSIPDVSSLATGTLATLYVQATGEGSNVSSCADVAVIPSLSVASTTVLSTDGEEVVNPETGSTVSYYEYYCSNSTILALDTCSCHCHGDHSHCTDTCSESRLTEANAQCVAEASGTASSSTSAAVAATSASSSAAATDQSSSSVAASAAAAASGSAAPTSSAQSLIGGGSLGVVAGLAGLVAVLL